MIIKLRRLRMTAAEIAETLVMPLSTISGILTRIGLGRLGRLGVEPAVRYERSRPGELVHIDVKKLGRIVGGAGWRLRGGPQHNTPRLRDAAGIARGGRPVEFVHIAVDDYSRLAYAEVLPDEKATTAAASCAAPSPSTAAMASRSKPSSPTTARHTSRSSTHSPAAACSSNTSALAPTGRRPTVRPSASSARCSPAGHTAPSTAQAANAPTPLTAGRLWHYNHRRRHSALGHQPPVSRTNLLGSYSSR